MKAQCEAPPPCVWTSFTAYDNTTIAPPCTLRVAYSALSGCGVNIVRVDAIQYLGCTPPPPISRGLYEQIAKAILIDNPMGYGPTVDPSCEDNWAVRFATCFARFDSHPMFSGAVDLPCLTADCCVLKYEVCLENGIRTVRLKEISGVECPNNQTHPTSPNPQCQGVCVP
ncbi:MAG: hypothetical protein K1X91_05635 [Bacteriodetes bacterium]|nr:hypothetical protein [Bacteroidota bacterium]